MVALDEQKSLNDTLARGLSQRQILRKNLRILLSVLCNFAVRGFSPGPGGDHCRGRAGPVRKRSWGAWLAARSRLLEASGPLAAPNRIQVRNLGGDAPVQPGTQICIPAFVD